MKLEVLISSLENRPEELIRKMHIESPAVIVNQCGESERKEADANGNRILIISDDGRGVQDEDLMRAAMRIKLYPLLQKIPLRTCFCSMSVSIRRERPTGTKRRRKSAN